MYNNVSREITRAGNHIFKAKSALLDDCFFQPELQDYSVTLLDAIRKGLTKAIPELSEKFNTSSLYFGYNVGEDEDRAYIYVQKSTLVIDIKVELSSVSKYVSELVKEGFVIKPRVNFQGQAGWLTGWKVPQSVTDIDIVVNWLRKALERNL